MTLLCNYYLWAFLLIFFANNSLYSSKVSQKFPVDISFLVVDLKYNKNQGVKICEIQNANLSQLTGPVYTNGDLETISRDFFQNISKYSDKVWIVERDISDSDLKKELGELGCIKVRNKEDVYKNPLFISSSSKPVYDPNKLNHYHGILYAKYRTIKTLKKIQKKYPSIIFLDAACVPYQKDKHKMSLLFSKNKKLEGYKPIWKIYRNKYKKDLVKSITNDIQSEVVVIKPCHSTLGRGVIIVHKSDLEKTLKYIFKKSELLRRDPDKSYSYWYGNKDTHFIVEEFIPSDPTPAAHLGGKLYDGTMRLAFTLVYQEQTVEVTFLQRFWKFPIKSLSEEGSLNEKHKSCGMLPYYADVSPDVLQEVETQLQEALTLLYRQMIGIE